ncbi:SCO2583 family membrane protein [Kitasatospora sp. NPDC004289]
MGDPLEPPEGVPDGGSGNEDEYRSVVFDESFVRAARIQELSARERMGGGYGRSAVRRRGLVGSLPRQALALMLVIVVAFAAAVYFGLSTPQPRATQPTGNQLTVSLVALVPSSAVTPVADRQAPFAGLSADYRDGAAGLAAPGGSATAHFTKAEVSRALAVVEKYLTVSALDPAVLTGRGGTEAVRRLLTAGEQDQFDQSLATPSDDQHHAATGWLVRFDPAEVALATETVKAVGAMRVDEADAGTLEIGTDHTFVYALRAADEPSGPVTLHTVRRALRFELDRADLAASRVRVVDSVLQAGPTACGTRLAAHLQPLLGGSVPPPATDPGDHAQPAWTLCAPLKR